MSSGVVFNLEPLIEDKDLKIHLRLEDTIVITETGAENLLLKKYSGRTINPINAGSYLQISDHLVTDGHPYGKLIMKETAHSFISSSLLSL